MLISNLCSPFFVLKRGVLGRLFIVFVKVIIWVIAPLVHCWAGGRHVFHLRELTLLVVIKFWGVAGVFVLLVFFSLIFIYRLKVRYTYNIIFYMLLLYSDYNFSS